MRTTRTGQALLITLSLSIAGCAGKSRSDANVDRSGTGGASGAASNGTGGSMSPSGTGGDAPSSGGTNNGGAGGADSGGAGFGAMPMASGGIGDPSPGGAGSGGAGSGAAGFGGAGSGGAGSGGAGSGGAGSGGRGCLDPSSAGADGCLQYCEPIDVDPPDLVEGYILGSDDAPVETSFEASVIVVEVDASERLILEAGDQQRWTLGLRIPGLPAEISQVGAAFDLSVVASRSSHPINPRIDQQIALSEAGEVLAFVGLNGTGLSMSANSNRCLESDGVCAKVQQAWFVSAGEELIVLFPHETREIGPYSVTLDESFSYLPDGFCDLVGTTEIAGVARD